MGHRRRAREFAVQILYQADLTGSAPPEFIEAFWNQQEHAEDVRAFAERLALGAWDQRLVLDGWITGAAQNWRLERMAAVDRNVLRLAVHEFLEDRSTPAAVVIDEAIEVARRFGGEDSARFVNGILDAVRVRLAGESVGDPGAGRTVSR